MSKSRNNKNIKPSYGWSSTDNKILLAIEKAEKKYKENGFVLLVVKTINSTIEVFTEFEMKMKKAEILEIIYSPDVGFYYP